MVEVKKTKQKKVKKEASGKVAVKEKGKKAVKKDLKYLEGVGRRKTAVARVRLEKGKKSFFVNEKPLEEYFRTIELQQNIFMPLILTDCLDKFSVSIRVKGGGVSSQSDAIRHGISRALILFEASFRKKLKKAGFLKRDPRMRERKKPGLKRARRAPQWKKR
jgi:small subunit ribosomal protein S9